MYQKNCDRCCRPSFSSSERSEWFCPICGNDLTALPFFDAMTMERIHIIALPLEKKLNIYQQAANNS